VKLAVAASLLALGTAGVVLVLLLHDGGPSLIEHGPRDRQLVALTFDADMTQEMLARLRSGRVDSWYDPQIVAALRLTRTPATIFLTGLWTQTYPDVVRSLARDPLFELENHSVDHGAFQSPCLGLRPVPSERKEWEIAHAAETIFTVAGVRPRYFRFPGGCHDSGDLRLVASLEHRTLHWDVSSGDAFERNPALVADAVLEQVRPGSIVVMHLGGRANAPATASALRMLIPTLRGRGFRFVTVRELLGDRTEKPVPRFHGTVQTVARDRLASSWRPGCPVAAEDLRLLTLEHWGFDGAVHDGELVVHEDVAQGVLGVFRTLFAERFPIAGLQLVDVYAGDDGRSMAANNSSGFNCRRIEGRPDEWSQHAYGRAIDLNPVQNPQVSGSGDVVPAAGSAHVDRSRLAPGMIHADDAVVRAFADIGWRWGGSWKFSKDYQHFSASGPLEG